VSFGWVVCVNGGLYWWFVWRGSMRDCAVDRVSCAAEKMYIVEQRICIEDMHRGVEFLVFKLRNHDGSRGWQNLYCQDSEESVASI
jgi:hypothetical protein